MITPKNVEDAGAQGDEGSYTRPHSEQVADPECSRDNVQSQHTKHSEDSVPPAASSSSACASPEPTHVRFGRKQKVCFSANISSKITSWS